MGGFGLITPPGGAPPGIEGADSVSVVTDFAGRTVLRTVFGGQTYDIEMGPGGDLATKLLDTFTTPETTSTKALNLHGDQDTALVAGAWQVFGPPIPVITNVDNRIDLAAGAVGAEWSGDFAGDELFGSIEFQVPGAGTGTAAVSALFSGIGSLLTSLVVTLSAGAITGAVLDLGDLTEVRQTLDVGPTGLNIITVDTLYRLSLTRFGGFGIARIEPGGGGSPLATNAGPAVGMSGLTQKFGFTGSNSAGGSSWLDRVEVTA